LPPNKLIANRQRTRRRLVQEDDLGVGDQRDADVGALGLAARDAALHLTADLDVAARVERQPLEQLLDRRVLGGQRLLAIALQLRRVHKHLIHGEDGQQRVCVEGGQ